MHRSKIDALGTGLFRQSLKPYTPVSTNCLIFGLDTEFRAHPKGNKLICWQLSLDKDNCQLFTIPLTWQNLYVESRKMAREAKVKINHNRLFVYAVYFSTAECQWLDWLASSVEIFGAHQINLKYSPSTYRSMYVYDVANWYPAQPLKQVAQTFGLEKLEYKGIHKLSPQSLEDAKFRAYALNDAYIAGEILKRLRDAELSESGIDIILTKTPASTAAAHFRSVYIPKGESYGQRDTTLRRRALWASYGGRKEAFYRGFKPTAFEYDARKCYATTASNMEILPLEHHWFTTADIDEWLNARGGIGTVRFNFNGNKYPCLPMHINNRTHYVSKGVSDCTSFEAKTAIAQGADVVLLKGYAYNHGVTWLSDYERMLCDRRRTTTDPALDELLKFKANAIIGKLTQKRMDYNPNDVLDFARDMDVPPEVAYNVANKPYKRKLRTGQLYYPEWNTLILGKARATMAKAIMHTSALQVCTDAVQVEQDMGESFEIDGILFQRVHDGDYVAYRAGLYRIGDEYRFHGGDASIAKLALKYYRPNTELLEYTKDKIVTFKQALRSGQKWGSISEQPRKLWLRWDNKRQLLEDGYTLPWKDEHACNLETLQETV